MEVNVRNVQNQNWLKRLLSVITLEPAILLVSLGYGFSMIIGSVRNYNYHIWTNAIKVLLFSQNLIIDKVCLVNLGYDPKLCANLSSHKDEQVKVQQMTATISMYQSILTAIPAVIASLFLGPWSGINSKQSQSWDCFILLFSDTHGRKPLMLAPMIGTMLSQLMYILNTYFSHWKAEYVLLSAIGSMCGGFTCFLVGIYAYIADKTALRSRTSRVAFVDLFVFLGFPVGSFLSAPLFKAGGYYLVFSLVRNLLYKAYNIV